MELTLESVVPVLRKCRDGRMRFNKGYTSPMKGKTLEELYGGRLVARFASGREAAACLGVTANAVCCWLKGKARPRNGWMWFYEEDSRRWGELINQ